MVTMTTSCMPTWISSIQSDTKHLRLGRLVYRNYGCYRFPFRLSNILTLSLCAILFVILKKNMDKTFMSLEEFWNPDKGCQPLTISKRLKSLWSSRCSLTYESLWGKQGRSWLWFNNYFDDSLAQINPDRAVTFVDNHDTQRGQTLESTVEEWFKPAAYALILLREQGLPHVSLRGLLRYLWSVCSRRLQRCPWHFANDPKELAYGEQTDYFDDPNCIPVGFVQVQKTNPLTVLISNAQENIKTMFVGPEWAGQSFSDLLGNHSDQVTISAEGYGDFPVAERSVSVWGLVN